MLRFYKMNVINQNNFIILVRLFKFSIVSTIGTINVLKNPTL